MDRRRIAAFGIAVGLTTASGSLAVRALSARPVPVAAPLTLAIGLPDSAGEPGRSISPAGESAATTGNDPSTAAPTTAVAAQPANSSVPAPPPPTGPAMRAGVSAGAAG